MASTRFRSITSDHMAWFGKQSKDGPAQSTPRSDRSSAPDFGFPDEPFGDPDLLLENNQSNEPAVLTARVYGEKTTFGSVPWWSEKDWWKLAPEGEANDVRCQVGTYADLAVAAVSLRGNKHRLQGAVNDDSYAIAHTTGDDGRGYLLVAVSDGMGSAKHSSFGARLAAQNALRVLLKLLADLPGNGLMADLTEHQADLLSWITREVLGYRANEFGAPTVDANEFDSADAQCTLTFAIVPTGEPTRSREAVIGIVGDSPAFLVQNGRLTPIEPAKDLEGLWSSSSDGLLGATSMVITSVELEPGDGLLLTSDGIGNFLTHGDQETVLGLDIASRWKRPVGMLDFIRDASFELQSADDDRTAVMIWIDE